MPDVVVVGAGPVGLLAAAELRRLGCDVTVIERRPVAGPGSRAIGLHSPSLAALEPGGYTERLLAEALRVDRGEARADGEVLGVVRFDRLSRRFPFVATLPQAATERVLTDAAPAVERGVTVRGVVADRDAVRIGVERAGGPGEMRAAVVIVASGAGARDLVYRPGAVAAREYADRYLMSDAPAGGRPVAEVHLDRGGVLESFPMPGGLRRFVAWDPSPDDDAPTARTARLREAVADRVGADAAASIAGATSFRVRRAVAPRLRRGRVVVIGDAAHEVSPIGGQGMNLGLLDAVTLAPLVAAWARGGDAPDAELARWERRRVASARRAAMLASLNTGLGRPLGAAGDRARRAALRVLLAGPAGRAFAHAYAMSLDLDA
ncbi:2-polyprenyl-6-methoxyphenol hydroxylase-like FAD-dependent oxidoreductase [Microbacterium sp. SLBN-154]|uniref:FAD-dependent oxidoreductase n=1 Tax=Microbacterium sp. SLBN-154 TaxID=2768458 RepID=UPI001153B3C3|nr:NAD(P)/FAD-dependent oxidoreductase [Microbacterium sp. SLBN-154]TQK18202.1 2-polyprenyl-6-methoxyphenol hydroxylase-like FAD-dependent oxidoreductase [Microbacterium sp. SLBN-154]